METWSEVLGDTWRRWEGGCLFLIIRGAGGENGVRMKDEPVQVAAYLCRVGWEREETKICGLNSFCGTEIFLGETERRRRFGILT